MSRRIAAASILVPLLAGSPVSAGAEVVLKDGSTIPVSKPYVARGATAVLARPDGSLVSVPLSSIDVDATARAMAAPAPTPAPAPAPVVPPRPLTPADAARIRGERKAKVVLTDADVPRSQASPGAAPRNVLPDRPDGARPAPPGAAEGEAEQRPEPKKAAATPSPTPPPVPPGWAAPQANAVIEGASGSPPTGAFLPRPSDSQARPPQ